MSAGGRGNTAKRRTLSGPQNPVDRLLHPLNYLTWRFALVYLCFAGLIFFVINHFYEPIVKGLAPGITEEVANELRAEPVTHIRILDSAARHHLAWCYLTRGNEVTAFSQHLAPKLVYYSTESRVIDEQALNEGAATDNSSSVILNLVAPDKKQKEELLKGRYYEVVVPFEGRQSLHAGFAIDSPPFSQLTGQLQSFHAGKLLAIPDGATMIGVSAIVFLFTLLLLQMLVSRPLTKVSNALDSFNQSGEYTKERYDEIINSAGGLNELKLLVVNMTNAIRFAKRVDDQTRVTSTSLPELPPPRTDDEPAGDLNDRILHSLEVDLAPLKSAKSFASQVLQGLSARFPAALGCTVLFRLDKDLKPRPESLIGITEDSAQPLTALDYGELMRGPLAKGKYLDIGPMSMRRYGLEEMAEATHTRKFLFFRLHYLGRDIGVLVVLVKGLDPSAEHLRSIERFCDDISSAYHALVVAEETEEAHYTHDQSGLKNKIYFQELMAHLYERGVATPEPAPFSVLIIAAENFDKILQKHGIVLHDKVFRELVETISESCSAKDKWAQSARLVHLVLYQAHEIVVVLENMNAEKALDMARKIRNDIDNRKKWSGGVTSVPITIGGATFPIDGENPKQLMGRARVAWHYVQDHAGTMGVKLASTLPADYVASQTTATMGGELGVLDCAGLLQSIASAKRSGMLTVQDDLGRSFVIGWQNGKATHASLDKLKGNNAAIEFVRTFESGSYNFQQGDVTVDPSSDHLNPVEHIILDAALAEDQVNVARKFLRATDLLVSVPATDDMRQKWWELKSNPDVSSEEISVMEDLLKSADGNSSLAKLLQRFEQLPSHLVWRGAGLLVEHGLIQTKSV